MVDVLTDANSDCLAVSLDEVISALFRMQDTIRPTTGVPCPPAKKRETYGADSDDTLSRLTNLERMKAYSAASNGASTEERGDQCQERAGPGRALPNMHV